MECKSCGEVLVQIRYIDLSPLDQLLVPETRRLSIA